MKPLRCLTVLTASLMPVSLVVLVNLSSCKQEETESPATTTPPPATTTTTTLTPEVDAGPDAAEDADAAADADAAKPTGQGGDPTGIRKCCQALRQNANTAPPEQKAGYLAAAAACDGMVSSPQGRQALAGLRGFLLGAKLPAACQ